MVYLPVLAHADFALQNGLGVYLIKYFIILLHNYIYTDTNYYTSVYDRQGQTHRKSNTTNQMRHLLQKHALN